MGGPTPTTAFEAIECLEAGYRWFIRNRPGKFAARLADMRDRYKRDLRKEQRRMAHEQRLAAKARARDSDSHRMVETPEEAARCEA